MIIHRINYAMPSDKAMWINRIEKACSVLEEFFPHRILAVALDASNPDVLVSDRRQYLKDRINHSARLFTLTNGVSHPRNQQGSTNECYISIGGRFNGPTKQVYDLGITFQTETWDECERLFAAVGDAVSAYSAEITPKPASELLRSFQDLSVNSRYKQAAQLNCDSAQVDDVEKLHGLFEKIGQNIPKLDDDPLAVRQHPAQPASLGWINYWSPQTCEYLGFPNKERDKDLLQHSWKTSEGAWVVKLCQDPLDVIRLDHLKKFVDVYSRFQGIGIRLSENLLAKSNMANYPQNTIFIHERNLMAVAERLIAFFRARDLKVSSRPLKKGAQDAVLIGLFSGSEDWTVIKTIPGNFFSKNLTPSADPILIEFCRDTESEGLMLDVYSETEATLLECNAVGEKRLSGFMDATKPLDSSGTEDVFESEIIPVFGFHLLPLELDILDFDNFSQCSQQIYSELAGRNADLCDNSFFSASLINNLFQGRGGLTLYIHAKSK